MRHSIVALFFVLASLLLAACKDDETTPTPAPAPVNPPANGADGGGNASTPDGGALTGGDCPGAKITPDTATVDALYSMFGSWQWEKQRLNNNESDITNVCVKANGHLIGPEQASQATYDYARCAVASQTPVPVRSGEYTPTDRQCGAAGSGCARQGLRMISAKSGGVYALRPDGQTTGNPGTYFLPIPGPTSGTIELMDSPGGTTESGNRMARRAAAPNCP